MLTINLFKITLDLFAITYYMLFMIYSVLSIKNGENPYIGKKPFNRVQFGDDIVPRFTASVKINSIEEKWIPQYEGVYLFHDLRGVYYIGESNNLQRRFDQHKYKKSNIKLITLIQNPIHNAVFSWIRTTDCNDRKKLEKKLVFFFKPVCNSIHYKTKGGKYVSY